LLPIPFLRQLIRFYDDSIGRMVPSYLQFSLETLVKEQEKFRTQFASAFGNPAAAFEAYQEQARKNMAMFEQAMSLWSPFAAMQAGLKKAQEAQAGQLPQSEEPEQSGESAKPARDELGELKAQLAAMQQKIEKLSQGRE
jgi:polyhydroxyalkanoate synthesis regulator protein